MRSTVTRILGVLASMIIGTGVSQAASVVLTFGGLNPTDQNQLFVIGPYQSQGLSLSSTLGFNTYGSGLSGFFAGSPGLSPIGGSTVQLRASDGSSFSLTSISLARNFDFDPAPTVTFTGDLAGGGTVTESFTVTTPVGTAAFQAFNFSTLNDVTAVTWNQPPDPATGLHQFSDITVSTGGVPSTVPEPASLMLFSVGFITLVLVARRKLLYVP